MRRSLKLLAASPLLPATAAPAQASGVDMVSGRGATTTINGAPLELSIAAQDSTPGTGGEDGRGQLRAVYRNDGGSVAGEDIASVVCTYAVGNVAGVLARVDRRNGEPMTHLEYHAVRIIDGGPGRPDSVGHYNFRSGPLDAWNEYQYCAETFPASWFRAVDGNFRVRDGA